jgi:hypothetical protein
MSARRESFRFPQLRTPLFHAQQEGNIQSYYEETDVDLLMNTYASEILMDAQDKDGNREWFAEELEIRDSHQPFQHAQRNEQLSLPLEGRPEKKQHTAEHPLAGKWPKVTDDRDEVFLRRYNCL